ncbi:hypothetical protein [Streptomyces roseoverticillatus]|uniref:Uncharacterized protein n=1 Tax=Streptomyces roseoverticillatus TaxID=66429 RepID=A0ABV3IV45_9ACTN
MIALSAELVQPSGLTPARATGRGDRHVSGVFSAAASAQQRASHEAQETGQRVEVVEQQTETEEVFANPDGTFTAEQTAQPQRVKQSSVAEFLWFVSTTRRPDRIGDSWTE